MEKLEEPRAPGIPCPAECSAGERAGVLEIDLTPLPRLARVTNPRLR
jgi:hypothetical protein